MDTFGTIRMCNFHQFLPFCMHGLAYFIIEGWLSIVNFAVYYELQSVCIIYIQAKQEQILLFKLPENAWQ